MARSRALTRRCVNPENAPSAPARRRTAIRWTRAGLAACRRGNFARAFGKFAKAAAKSDAEGQFRLAMAYARGEGVVASLADAVLWFRQAAEQGHAEAQFQLGLAYLNGGQAGAGVPN